MTTSIQERHDAKMRLRLDASDGALIFEDFIGALAYDIGCETRDPADVMNRLADLIEPEPKHYCRWIWGEEWLESTSENPRELQWANWYPDCGCWDGCEQELAKFDDPDDEPSKWEYCPICGAKVVGE